MPHPSVDRRPRGGTPAARPYHHGALHDALLDAAESWLDEHGGRAPTLRELAKAAGVSHAAPYHHFASLDDLLAGVAERGFGQLADAMSAAAAGGRSAREGLLDIAEAYVRAALAHPARFRLMFGPTLARKSEHAGLKAAAERAFDVLVGAARAHDPERAVELALAGWSLSHGVANLAIDGAFEGLPLAKAQARAIARLDAGVLARQVAEHLLGAEEQAPLQRRVGARVAKPATPRRSPRS
jgi:AcrR family transcriptional regulator